MIRVRDCYLNRIIATVSGIQFLTSRLKMLSQPNYRHRQWHTISDLTPEEHKAIFFTKMSAERERVQFESHRNSREFWLRQNPHAAPGVAVSEFT